MRASNSVTSSVAEYKALQDFVATVKQSCSEIKDGSGQQNLQLVTFLESVRDRTWAGIRDVLSTWVVAGSAQTVYDIIICRTLLAISEKLRWPMPVNYASASPEDRRAFESAFLNLLRLQTMSEPFILSSDSYTHKSL
jgi:hypothetical protein